MEIVFYQTLSGRKPVLEYIQGLAPQERLKIVRVLERMEQTPNLGEKGLLSQIGAELKPIEGKLWEIKFRGRQNRIFYVMKSNRIVILLHAISKKQWKIPESDLSICRKRMQEVLV